MPDWTTPKTWETDELVTAGDMNAHIRDNLDHLHTRMENYGAYTMDEPSDYSAATGGVFVDIDADNLSATLTTTKDNALVAVHFHGCVSHSAGAGAHVQFNVTVDGTPVAGNDGIISWESPGYKGVVSFTILIPVAAAGEHDFTLQWKQDAGGTLKLYAGAGTTAMDVHSQFWAKEL